MDITKFYPSIDHNILKSIISRKIKDTKVLEILYEIIDSVNGINGVYGKGVPIGNYLSQYFANLYLTGFDHWCKEELKCRYYYRYADDIVILGESKAHLRNVLVAIKLYLKHVLKLGVKGNYQIFPVESRGIDFVGYVFRHEDDGFMDVFDSRSNRFGDRFRDSGMRGNDMDRIIKYMRHSMNDGEHFTESEAMDLVSDMYHTEGGRKYSGEKFDIHKAKEICERYRGVIPVSATPTDVYVAINSQYHDYVKLFKSWFGDNVDQKIIESAIIFWFKDVDCKSRNKVVSYFKEY
jgi:hypothetical protein